MNTATIIFCNDTPYYAFYNTPADAPEVKAKLEELATAHFGYNKHAYADYAEYRMIAYWHTHTIDAA